MKRAITFSIEEHIVDDFQKETGEKRNSVLEKLMYDYVSSKNNDSTVKCATCGAEYSQILIKCPQCQMKENLQFQAEHGMNLEQMKARLEVMTRKYMNGDPEAGKELNELREAIKKAGG